MIYQVYYRFTTREGNNRLKFVNERADSPEEACAKVKATLGPWAQEHLVVLEATVADVEENRRGLGPGYEPHPGTGIYWR